MSVQTTREALAKALKNYKYNVYSHPSEVMIAPAAVIVPGSPYVSMKGNNFYTVYFQVTLMVTNNNNQAALIQLERMIDELIDNAPAWISIGDFSQPTTLEVGSTEYLTTDLTIELQEV